MRKYICLSILLLILAAGSGAQTSKVPKFSQYPAAVETVRVKGINFKKNPDARTFRTRLSYAFGGGVNFAGHYIITGWGCGTGCTNGAIIEGRTGDVLWPDQFMNIDATYGDAYSDKQLDFQKNSRLLIIHGRPGSREETTDTQPSGDYYYEWKNNRFRLLKVVKKD